MMKPMYFIGFTIGFILLSFGTHGWYERHLLFDRERERQIKNGWAAQRIQVVKAQPSTKEIADKKVYIECPICHVTNIEVFSSHKVESRYNDARGITIERIPRTSNCGHAICIFVDRNFKVRATEPFEDLDLATVAVTVQ